MDIVIVIVGTLVAGAVVSVLMNVLTPKKGFLIIGEGIIVKCNHCGALQMERKRCRQCGNLGEAPQ